MKRCPECRRDYYDETLLYCLDDGNALLEGPASDEPATAIQNQVRTEAPTKRFANTDDKENVRHASNKNSLIAGVCGILLITVLGVGSYIYYDRKETSSIDSIAVMPFVNEGSDPDTEYLSQQLPESLIYRLSQVSGLKVSPTSSMIKYRGKEFDPIKAGTELGVNTVLIGHITQRGDGLIVSAELIDVRNKKSDLG